MTDCKQMREALDLYVDGELSPEATAAARLHLNECAACRQAERQLLLLREGVKGALAQYRPPDELAQWVHMRFGVSRRRRLIAALTVAAVLVVTLAGAMASPSVRGFVASAMEQFAFHLDSPRTVEIEGRIVCRECELKRVYGSDVMVASQGHGALETPDGKIWNFMDTKVSGPLLNDDSLQGKVIRLRGKIYRRAGCVEVESYEIVSFRRAS
jgi:putative zinc finger protein